MDNSLGEAPSSTTAFLYISSITLLLHSIFLTPLQFLNHSTSLHLLRHFSRPSPPPLISSTCLLNLLHHFSSLIIYINPLLSISTIILVFHK
ncbi:Cytochrome c oxidase subunit 3 [Clarias magur]|uniref:Cytochrome c oxidase subunit 3 n=1 Tax=Clarias magur TaxID=1594786 RepID=A0A8J4TZX6_CLAMG|nr:Cytochrome c oxidase subunit 3 [Clarias magur]